MDEQPRINKGVRMGMGRMKVCNLLRRHLALGRELRTIEEVIVKDCREYLKNKDVSGMDSRMLRIILKGQRFYTIPNKELRDLRRLK